MKPSLDEFTKAVSSTRGNLTKTSELFGVSRQTIMNWVNGDEDFKAVVNDSRKRMLDKCLEIGYLAAMGIPRLDADGKVIGWIEKPDTQMLRYYISTLGRDEGFGERSELKVEGEIPTVINIVAEKDTTEN